MLLLEELVLLSEEPLLAGGLLIFRAGSTLACVGGNFVGTGDSGLFGMGAVPRTNKVFAGGEGVA